MFRRSTQLEGHGSERMDPVMFYFSVMFYFCNINTSTIPTVPASREDHTRAHNNARENDTKMASSPSAKKHETATNVDGAPETTADITRGSDREERMNVPMGDASFLHGDQESSDGFLVEFSAGTTLPVHPAILSTYSRMFQAMLFRSDSIGEGLGSYRNMQESVRKRIRMERGTADTQKQFVKWMYALPDAIQMSERTLLDAAPMEDMIALFELAHYYQCNAMLCVCARYMTCRLEQYLSFLHCLEIDEEVYKIFRGGSMKEGLKWLPKDDDLVEGCLEWIVAILNGIAPYCSDGDQEVERIVRPVLERAIQCVGLDFPTWINDDQLCMHIRALHTHTFTMMLESMPREHDANEIEFVKFLIRWIRQRHEHHTSGQEPTPPDAPLQLDDFRGLLQTIQWHRISMEHVVTMHKYCLSHEFQDLPIGFREELLLALLEVQIRKTKFGAAKTFVFRYRNNEKKHTCGKRKMTASFKRKKHPPPFGVL